MLNSGKKFRESGDKKIIILTLVLSEKNILNETKNHNPPPLPFKLNGRSLTFLPRFFPPPKSEYFFQQHWESEYFFRKKP
jgi:hypothetical protein